MADDAIRQELDALKEDIEKLREDMVNLTNAVKGAASDNMSDVKQEAEERIYQAWSEIEQRLEELLNEGKATFNKAEYKVGEHPLSSVLTAFGVGFVIAKMMDTGGRR